MNNESLSKLLGIKYPIFLSPMAGETNPLIVAEFCNAGGMGGLGCARMSPSEVADSVKNIRKLTDKPFNLNFFCFDDDFLYEDGFEFLSEKMRRTLEEKKITLGNLKERVEHFSFNQEMLRVLSKIKPDVVSFHFGPPSIENIAVLHDIGSKVFCTATSVSEAVFLAERGVDVVIAQGWEAGGHQGTFLNDDFNQGIGALSLIPQIVDSVDVPIIAAGGVADGRGMAASLILGASGVQLGTAFLSTPEASISTDYREKLASVKMGDTIISCAYSGRPARCLRNDYIDFMDKKFSDYPMFPLMYQVGEKLRNRLCEDGDLNGDNNAYLLGQSGPMNRQLTTALLVEKIIEELDTIGDKKMFRKHFNL